MKSTLLKLLCGILLCSVGLLQGCQNTVHGFGKDMQQNGKDIQKSDEPNTKSSQ